MDELEQRAHDLQAADRWDDEAAAVNQAILDRHPGNAVAAIRLGRCLETAGRYEEARDMYRRAEASGSPVAYRRIERLERVVATSDSPVAAPARTETARLIGDDRALEIVRKTIPQEAREPVLRFIAGTIELAERLDGDRLYAYPLERGRSFRLMGGNMSLLRVPWEKRFYVQMVGDGHAELMADLEAAGWLDRHEPFAQLPSAVAAWLPFEEVERWAPRIRPAHDSYVEFAMATPPSGHRAKHQPALLRALRPSG